MASVYSRAVSPSVLAAFSYSPTQYSLPFIFPTASGASWLYTSLAVIVSLLVLEQGIYRYKKSHLPGATWTIPIVGKFLDSMHPTLENYQKQWNSGALSVVSVFNIFIVMASSNEYAVKIFNSPSYAEPCLVHSAKHVLMPDNWVFLNGKEHVAYRKGLNGLFTRKALSLYCNIQDAIARKHFTQWLKAAKEDPSAKSIMFTARDLNMETSLKVFCGSHIPDYAVKEINDKYWLITSALELVNFPLAVPGTKIWKAIQARKVAHKWLELAAKSSKLSMTAGNQPECMLDAWVVQLNDPAYKGRRDFSDREMAMVLFSFIFASQDAMSSGLIFGFQHLSEHPDILAMVREESDRVRSDPEKPITLEMLDKMPYIRAFVKESLRVRPPVTMVPYKCTRSFNISPDYTVPVNSMVIPSIYPSLHDPTVYAEPDKLDPKRWLDPDSSANRNPRNYLTFGSGPHRCIGLEYAMMNMIICLSNAVMLMDWEHERTTDSDGIQIIATMFPKDGCRLKFHPRIRG